MCDLRKIIHKGLLPWRKFSLIHPCKHTIILILEYFYNQCIRINRQQNKGKKKPCGQSCAVQSWASTVQREQWGFLKRDQHRLLPVSPWPSLCSLAFTFIWPCRYKSNIGDYLILWRCQNILKYTQFWKHEHSNRNSVAWLSIPQLLSVEDLQHPVLGRAGCTSPD